MLGWIPGQQWGGSGVCDLGGAVGVTTRRGGQSGEGSRCEDVQGGGMQAGVGPGPAVGTLEFGPGWVWVVVLDPPW